METLFYMLAGGALVLAGIFIGERLRRPANNRTQAATLPEAPQISEADVKRVASLREQWDNIMSYDGREQKAGGEQ